MGNSSGTGTGQTGNVALSSELLILRFPGIGRLAVTFQSSAPWYLWSIVVQKPIWLIEQRRIRKRKLCVPTASIQRPWSKLTPRRPGDTESPRAIPHGSNHASEMVTRLAPCLLPPRLVNPAYGAAIEFPSRTTLSREEATVKRWR